MSSNHDCPIQCHNNIQNTSSQIETFKRPILSNNILFNDVYIKNNVPLCVYYRRCVRLLRCHILTESHVFNQDSFKKHNIDLNLGEISNKNDISLPINGIYKNCDSAEVNITNNTLNQQLNHKGIRICASGSCVRKALYLLHDIFNFLSNYYSSDPSPLSYKKSHRSKITMRGESLNPKTLDGLKIANLDSTDSSIREPLEDVLKNLFDVDISTDTIHSVDDTWSFKADIDGDFDCSDLMDDSSLQTTPKERFVSSITITIKFRGHENN